MFIQVTKDKSVRMKDVIGVFDFDTATVMRATAYFLTKSEKKGKTVGITTLPRSFVLTDSNNIFGGKKRYDRKSKDYKIYFSSSMTGHIDKTSIK